MAVVDGRPSVALVHNDTPARVGLLDVTSAGAGTFWPDLTDEVLYGPGLYVVDFECSATTDTAWRSLRWWLDIADDSGGSPGTWAKVSPGGTWYHSFELYLTTDNYRIVGHLLYQKTTAVREFVRVQMQVAAGAIRSEQTNNPDATSSLRILKVPIW